MKTHLPLTKPGLNSLFAGIAGLLSLLFVETASADSGSQKKADSKRYCSDTTSSALEACKHEIKDDHFIALAKCTNIPNRRERAGCLKAADEELNEGRELCNKQRTERRRLCAAVGEDRYSLNLSPALFDSDYTNLTNPNPYFPLTIGNRWEYQGGDEVDVVEVLNETKLIEGIRCIVLKDQVTQTGRLHEDTDD